MNFDGNDKSEYSIAIMQPYIFPYIGYFQLINLVDKFVVYDDVQWIRRGWINRNRILVNGQSGYITIPVKKANKLAKINEMVVSDEFVFQKKKIMRKLEMAYGRAPFFEQVICLVQKCMSFKEGNICEFIVNSIRECCKYLSIDTPMIYSSELGHVEGLSGENRIIHINKMLNSTHYVNPIGGVHLYNKNNFLKNRIKLSFIKTRNIVYDQFIKSEFVPFLSIIDVMMFNSVDSISCMLKEYDLE